MSHANAAGVVGHAAEAAVVARIPKAVVEDIGDTGDLVGQVRQNAVRWDLLSAEEREDEIARRTVVERHVFPWIHFARNLDFHWDSSSR